MSKYSAMDYWFAVVVSQIKNPRLVKFMYKALKSEQPRILSVVGERWCNQQCLHCAFQPERSSAELSGESKLSEKVARVVPQMCKTLYVVHEGRTFNPKHLGWLIAIKKTRPDCKIGIIDNGSYVQHINAIKRSGFRFDWIDISIDGTKEVHNKQRNNDNSFAQAITGIENAHAVLRCEGKINSLFTLTKINFDCVLAACKILPREISEWHITTITPLRPEIAHLSVSDEEFCMSWFQILAANKIRPVNLRIYIVEDLFKLAKAVGKDKFFSALSNAYVDLASISFELEEVKVVFYPQSVAPSETWVIDADGSCHAPYSIGFTLEELHRGISRFGEDIRKYTIQEGGEKDFKSLYAKAVDQWRNEFGLKYLENEKLIFDQIRNL